MFVFSFRGVAYSQSLNLKTVSSQDSDIAMEDNAKMYHNAFTRYFSI